MNLIRDLFEHFCNRSLIDQRIIGYILAVIPRDEALIPIFKSELLPSWDLHTNFADHMENNCIKSSFHLFWLNPTFEEIHGLSAYMIAQMEGAICIANQTANLVNFSRNTTEEKYGEELIEYASFLAIHNTEIEKKLKKYNRRRKMIWAKSLPFMNTLFNSTIFGLCYRQNLRQLQRFGLKISIVSTDSPEWITLRNRFKMELLLTLIECLTTEGSSFLSLILPNGQFNPSCFSNDFIDQMVGDFAGVMSMEFQNRTLFAGLVFGKISNQSPQTLRTALLFPKIFRGNGLGGTLAMYGMNIMENNFAIEKYEVFSTVRNKITENLVSRAGFFEYGTIFQSSYDISGHQSNLSYSVGMNRTYLFSCSLLRKLLKQDYEPALKKHWKHALKLQQAILK